MSEVVHAGVTTTSRPKMLAAILGVLATLLALVPSLQAAVLLQNGELGLNDPYPWYLFARVALAKSVVPLSAALMLGACALIPGLRARIIAAVASCVVCAAMLLLIMGQMVSPIPTEPAALIPAVAYLAISRRPRWWIAAPLAIAPLALMMSTGFYA